MPLKMQIDISKGGVESVRFLSERPGDPKTLDEAFKLFQKVREGLAVIDRSTNNENLVEKSLSVEDY